MPTPSPDWQRILPVLVHVQANLASDHALEAMAHKAALSPHHFHRVFSATVGETPKRYVNRLRLERAAFRLRTDARNILDVAVDVGFESHATFTRAFSKQFGMAPSRWRDGPWAAGLPEERASHDSPWSISGTSVRELRALPLAFRRHTGPYEDVPPDSWSRIAAWMKTRAWTAEILLGIGHDAPGVTPPGKLRFDAAVVVPEAFRSDGDIARQDSPAGHFASTVHIGPYHTLTGAYPQVMAQVAGVKGWRWAGLPVVEFYRTTTIRPDYLLNETEICIPIQRS